MPQAAALVSHTEAERPRTVRRRLGRQHWWEDLPEADPPSGSFEPPACLSRCEHLPVP